MKQKFLKQEYLSTSATHGKNPTGQFNSSLDTYNSSVHNLYVASEYDFVQLPPVIFGDENYFYWNITGWPSWDLMPIVGTRKLTQL